MKLIRKKLLVLTVLAMTALIFYGCSDSPKTVSVEGISPIVVVTGPTLVNDDLYIWETNTDGKLTSAVLNAVVQPPTATNKSVNWVLKAGSEYVNFDPATRTVSAIAVSGESYATIKATTVDGDFPATLRVFVLAAGDEPGPGGTDTDATVPFTWKFSTTIPGWQDYAGASNPVMKTDAVLANNMTITASKLDVATAANGIRWQPARTAAGMTGCIQPDGSNALARGERFVKIEDVPGPFSITLNYTSTNATNNGRFAQLYIDGTKVADGAPTPASNADTTLRQLKYDHTGTGTVTVEIGANFGIRLYEVILETLALTSLEFSKLSENIIENGETLDLKTLLIAVPALNITTSNLQWESNSSKVTVTQGNSGGVIEGIEETDTPVRITVKSSDNPTTVFASIDITVVGANFVDVTNVDIKGAKTLGDFKYLWVPVSTPLPLTAEVNANATNQNITWSSSVTSGAGAVTVAGSTLTAGATATAIGNSGTNNTPTWTTITATSVSNPLESDTVRVVVLPNFTDTHDTGPNWKHHWSFREHINEWMVYDSATGSDDPRRAATTMRDPVTLPHDLKLNAGETVPRVTNNAATADDTTTLGVLWMPLQRQANSSTFIGAIQTTGPTLPMGTTGSGGAGNTTFDPMDTARKYFLEVAEVSVPFKITLRYSNTGGNPRRHVIVYVDGEYVDTIASGNTGSNSTTEIDFSHDFFGNGEDTVTVQLGSSHGIRLYDIILEKIDPPLSGFNIHTDGNRTITAGNSNPEVPAGTLQFEARDGEEPATGTITWYVRASGVFTDDTPVTAATIDINDGLLTAATDIDDDATVWVFAQKDGTLVSTNSIEVTVKKYVHVTPPEIGLARRFFGNATGNYEFKDGRLIITGAMSTGTGGMTTTARNYHLVYVTKPVKASAAYAVEVDIVMPGGTAPVSNIFDHANSLIGLAAIKGNPATQTADQLGYWLLAHRSLTAAPPRMRKPAGANHNNGSNSGFTAPPAATINQTWGILRSSATAATFTQKLDSGNVASQNDTNAIFVDTDDVYFGLIVSSNSTTPSTLVITALRVRFEGDDHYTNIDLSQTITGP